MVEQLAQRSALLCSSPEHSVHQILPTSLHLADCTYACVPSTASKVWYRNSPIAQLRYTHGGQSVSSVGLYHSIVRKLITTKLKPESVIYHAVGVRDNLGSMLFVVCVEGLTAFGLAEEDTLALSGSIQSIQYSQLLVTLTPCSSENT